MNVYKTTAKRIAIGLFVAAFAAQAAQAGDRPDNRAGPLGVGSAVSASASAVRPDDRAGPFGMGQASAYQENGALRPDDRSGILGIGSSQPAAVDPVHLINAQERARARDASVVGTTAQPLTPVERIIAQERGRSHDPSLFQVSATSPIEIVEPGGFDWGDAGIGAAGAIALMLVGLGTVLVLRPGRVRSA